MINRLISVFFIIIMAITSMILFIPAVIIWAVTSPFDRRRIILHQYTCFWGAMYTRIVPSWHVKLMNRKKFRKGVTYVIVSNHQSQLDILMAFNLFRHFKWVSKAEIFRVPFIGWNMYMNRYVYLLRGDKESIGQMMKASEKRLREGSSVFFFPEGTRSPDGKLKKFKPGAFILAHRLKLPILPVAISGTHKALPKHSMNFHGTHNLYLNVLDEIPYSAFASLTVEETSDMVRDLIMNNIDELIKFEEEKNE